MMAYDTNGMRREALFDDQGRWVVSAINRLAVVDHETKTASVIIHDDTLRSGANTPGVYATNEARIKIAQKLEEAGVRDIEAGYAGLSQDREFFAMLKRSGCKMQLGAHLLATLEPYAEIDQAIESGADVINMVAQLTVVGKAEWGDIEEEEVLRRVDRCIRYAKGRGARVACGGVAYSLESIRKLATTSVEAGANRVYVYDARGWYTPDAVKFLVRFVRDIVGPSMQIAFHGHDDSGLATINSLEAARAGADVIDVTINRTGHRCGNASFEQVVTDLASIYGIETGIDLSKVYELSKLVEELYGIKVPPNSPVVGDYMYSYGGVHINAILRGDTFVWENIQAETVGCRRSIMWTPTALERGGMAGPVALKIRQMGFPCTESQLKAVTDRLREVLRQKKVCTDDEMEKIVQQCKIP